MVFLYMITILGGVKWGSVKLVRGIYREFNDITVIANVADNFWFYGLVHMP